MYLKYLAPLFLFILLLSSCEPSTKDLLIGEWRVDEIIILDDIDEMEKEEMEQLEGSTISFLKNNHLKINIEGQILDNQWSLENNKIDVKNGSQFTIQSINSTQLILNTTTSYYTEDGIIEYQFSQKMSKS